MKLVVHFDGGSRGNPGPAGAGVVVQDAQGRPVFEAGFFLGRMTNNAAEYSGLLKGLDAAVQARAREVTVFADSELVVRQLNGDYRVKNPRLRDLFDAALVKLRTFERWTIKHIPREQNHRADELANAAMDAGEDVVVVDAIPAAAKPDAARRGAAGKTPAGQGGAPRTTAKGTLSSHPSAGVRVVIARCVKAADGEVCPAPCETAAEFVFDRTVPAGLCLCMAANVLRAVDSVLKSGKRVKVLCPHDGCGACLEVRAAE
ncbi:MAG TPA: ribonuclease HI family protein [Phycisphaerae bacterium]|nr:ribonuclease HI family protein [Phycisphaerae bacterium]